MKTYKVECWFRYSGGDEKDFFHTTVEANSEEDAIKKAKAIKRSIYDVIILKEEPESNQEEANDIEINEPEILRL